MKISLQWYDEHNRISTILFSCAELFPNTCRLQSLFSQCPPDDSSMLFCLLLTNGARQHKEFRRLVQEAEGCGLQVEAEGTEAEFADHKFINIIQEQHKVRISSHSVFGIDRHWRVVDIR